MTKYVFVTGGVVSGLGKGITASSIALLLKARGYKVFMQKFDPYINVDPGTMSPLQHGEVFVTADGSETDLDLGHYERFIDEELNYSSSISTGRIFSRVIENERLGVYDGKTVQIVPHVTNEIKKSIYEVAKSSNADIVITEIGGTIGDIESLSVLESLRQIRLELGNENTFYMHATLVPYLFGSGELKTKPTQHSVIELRSLGIQPDMIVCRTPISLDDKIKDKLSLFCSIPNKNIIDAVDVNNIYNIPINFYNQKMDEIILNYFNLKLNKIDLVEWNNLIKRVDNLQSELEIAIIGDYVELRDAYLSVNEALQHAGYEVGTKVSVKWICPKEASNNEIKDILKNVSGIVIPYGNVNENKENLMKFISFAKTNNLPFLGIDLGLQLSVMEYLKYNCNVDIEKEDNVIVEGQKRLGNYKVNLSDDSIAKNLYNTKEVIERHRHSLEINNEYKNILIDNGLNISGLSDEDLIDIVELPNHPYFLACSFRPEFKSRPIKAHPLFLGLVKASIKYNK